MNTKFYATAYIYNIYNIDSITLLTSSRGGFFAHSLMNAVGFSGIRRAISSISGRNTGSTHSLMYWMSSILMVRR